MKPGDKGIVHCPSNMLNNDVDVSTYEVNSSSPAAPKDTDVKYEFDVKECSPNPQLEMPASLLKIVDGKCFYFIIQSKDNGELALEVNEQDKYFPANVGIFNVYSAHYETGKINQQFKFNEKDNSFESIGKPGKIMLEGVNKNIVMYHNKGLPA